MVSTNLNQMFHADTVAGGLAVLALAAVIGLAVGAIPIKGVRLGVPGVLFAALLFGQFGLSADPHVLSFLRDFSLIIFIYSIGLQVGPSFVESLREEGLRLNMLALLVVVLGALMTAAVVLFAPAWKPAASGLYAGSFTTTPGFAAGQQALLHVFGGRAEGETGMAAAALAYTVSYPFGLVGPLLVIAVLRGLFRVDMNKERAALAASEEARRPPIEVMDIEITHPSCLGVKLRDHPLLRGKRIVLSRLLRDGVMTVPTGDTDMRAGDVFRAVAARNRLAEFVEAVGRRATVDMGSAAGDVQRMELVVTRTQVLRRPLRELDLIRRYGVTIARIVRAGVDLVPHAALRLHFGDEVIAVGPEAGLKKVAEEIGNSPEMLNRPRLIPIFVGIVLGVIVGSVPITLPGLHTPMRIGLAGGPLLAAIALSRLGSIGSVVWYMPSAATQLFRDFGLAVFLACVGFQSGDHFVQRAIAGGGLMFLVWGVALTVLPVFLIGCAARIVYRINFVTLSGWVAGSMTSSPALLFANDLAQSDGAALAYAAVAPLSILMPVICAQLLVVGLIR